MGTKTLVNLNTAEEDELAQVPGIGPALARRLVAARPFDSLDDVRRVPGIGASTLDRIAPYATVAETLPVEAGSPAVEVAPEGLSFVDVTPFENEEVERVAEVPADLIPPTPTAGRAALGRRRNRQRRGRSRDTIRSRGSA